jgi:hypothetical protein
MPLVHGGRTPIWLSEESQVKVWAAQTRVFDTKDRRKMLQVIVMTLATYFGDAHGVQFLSLTAVNRQRLAQFLSRQARGSISG